MLNLLHSKTKAEIAAMADDDFVDYLVWFKDANREFFEARDARQAAMDRRHPPELRDELLARIPLPLSPENQKIISDEAFQKLEASGITEHLDRFISEADHKKKQRAALAAKYQARIAEIKAKQNAD